MIHHQFNDFLIEIINEPTYKFKSMGNNFNYSKHYFGGNISEEPSSKHGIKVYNDNLITYNCIICVSGGMTSIHPNSAIINDEKILICCSNSIFCLSLPTLDKIWEKTSDLVTCFQIFKLQEEYLIHGEHQITKLDKDGKLKWEFSGSDIFVTTNNDEEFKIERDGIILTDFSNTVNAWIRIATCSVGIFFVIRFLFLRINFLKLKVDFEFLFFIPNSSIWNRN